MNNTTMDLAVKRTMLENMEKRNSKNGCGRNPTTRKQCPKSSCKAPIEKIDGCNNVHCTHCNAHICWVCLDYFDDMNVCYAHLRKAHGGFV